jgi:segregation and condensation protein B
VNDKPDAAPRRDGGLADAFYRVTFVDPPEPEPEATPDEPAIELPELDDSSPEEPAPAAGDAPIAEDAAVTADAPIAEDTAVTADAPIAEGAPIADQAPAPAPASADAAVAEEAPPASVKPEPVRLPLEALRPALEAILLVVDEPVAEVLLAQVLERPREEVVAALEALATEYTEAARGFDLRRAAGGWRLYTRDDFAPYVEKFVLDGQQARLTQAALETLAVVAYKQPVTRSRISAIRGVAVDGVIRTLLTRGMIEECGAEPDTGAHLYRTTTLFLEKLGLDSIDELPALAPLLPDLDTLDDVIAAS